MAFLRLLLQGSCAPRSAPCSSRDGQVREQVMLEHHADLRRLVDLLEVVSQFLAVDDDLAFWCSSAG